MFVSIFVLATAFVLRPQQIDCAEPQSVITIGGLFDSDQEEKTLAMAVDFVNKGKLLGPNLVMNFTSAKAGQIATFEFIQYACEHVEHGIMAIIGPMTSTSTKAVGPLSKALRIPQITPTATSPLLGNKNDFPYLVRMMPPDSVQSLVLVDLVDSFGWTNMALLTSNTEYGIHGTTAFQAEASKRKWNIVSVQQFEATADVDVSRQLQVIKSIGARVIIVNALASYTREVLKQARDLGMTKAGWAWVVTDGTTAAEEMVSELPVPDFLQGVIGSMPATGQGALWDEFIIDWDDANMRSNYTLGSFSAYSGLIVDAVLAFAYTVKNVHADPRNADVLGERLYCETSPVKQWQYADLMMEHFRKMRGNGIGSYLHFDSNLTPKTPKYDIVNLKADGWTKVGMWDREDGLTMTHPHIVSLMDGQKNVDDFVSHLANNTVTVVTVVMEPFVMRVKEGGRITNKLEGFCVDLLNTLAERIGFKFNMYVVEDGEMGIQEAETLQWNGAVRDLMDRKADMAVASMTISGTRDRYIDFTTPFLDYGATFVMKVPDKEKSNTYAFLEPLSGELWMYFIVTAILVGVAVSILNKASPYDHHGEFMYDDNDVQEKEHMTDLKMWKKFQRRKQRALSRMSATNATWFSTGLLVKQGGEIYPKSLSARITTMAWWLATVIISATYTANLAAFLSTSRSQQSINGVEALAAQDDVLYGTVMDSEIQQFFVNSESRIYRDMLDFMERRKTWTQNITEGVERARGGEYAFIAQSPILDYLVEQEPCNTVQTLGRAFGKLSYGIGLQKNSPFNDELSKHILQLRESGFIDKLLHKWQKEKGQCLSQQSDSSSDSLEDAGGQLGVSHMLGVFYIIYGGMVLGFVILIGEWISATCSSVDLNDEYKSNDVKGAFVTRWRLFKDDILEDWLHPFGRRCVSLPVEH